MMVRATLTLSDQTCLNRSTTDLLDRLRPVKEAFHDASNASQTCLAGTREQLLANIYEWFQNTEPSCERVFWLNGLAGTGKTTVARTIADRAHAQGRLAAAFFFSRNIGATRAPSTIIPTLVYQLAQYQPWFRSHICSAIASDKDVRDRAIATQSRSLLNDLSTLNVPNGPLLVVLDALDAISRTAAKVETPSPFCLLGWLPYRPSRSSSQAERRTRSNTCLTDSPISLPYTTSKPTLSRVTSCII
jgi:hypothetical protein